MEGHCSTGQSPQWAVVPMEEQQQQEQEIDTLPDLKETAIPLHQNLCYGM